MGKKVYANGNAIACKAGDAKVIAAFPDVCMSPPSPPAGPIPVPYPNTSFSKDLKKGSKTVKIGGKPIALKNQSFYKTSPLGNEAATRSFGAAVVTHQITGKTYFAAYSFDVKVEGKNVCRHLDLTTSNHGSYPGSTPPFPDMEEASQIALDLIEEGKCPCCGKEDCPAAFGPDDEPQSMEDFYGFNSTDSDGNLTGEAQDRMKMYRMLLGIKEKRCTCEGNVFPKAPCDVFRTPDAARTGDIAEQWDAQAADYYSQFTAENADAIAKFRETNPDQPSPSRGPRFNQVDHLTPKGAGGCPDNPNNLQPHDILCKACKLIDDQFGRWQGNSSRWREQWNEAFRASGIKRRTVSGFKPGFWR